MKNPIRSFTTLALGALAISTAGRLAAAPSTQDITVGGVSYTVVTFTDTSAATEWTVPSGIDSIDYLIVGGGGGGGYQYGGGGGGGNVKTGTLTGLAGGETLTITVGAGGAGSVYNSKVNGANGGDSTLLKGATEVAVAKGGGGGGYLRVAGSAGGCGGGGGQNCAGGKGETYNGGSAGTCGGGGGGAGGAGGNGAASQGGAGGAGVTSDITGTEVAYAGGGGGGGNASTAVAAFGGVGKDGGGNGGTHTSDGSVAATAGVDGLGGGGGGGAHQVNGYYDGADGGSGVVILRYSAFKQNAWVEGPSLTKTQWRAGDAAGTLVATPKYGTVTRNYTDAEIASLGKGKYTLTCSVAAGASYSGLDEVSIDFTVLDSRIGPTGDPDAAALTYTWTGSNATGYWYDSLNWSSLTSPCFGYPANSYATATFGASTNPVVVEGDDQTYALAALNAGCDLTLKGGAYETATLAATGSRFALDGATLANTTIFKPSVVGFTFVLNNGATYRQTANRIQFAAANQVLAVTNSTFESYLDLRQKNQTATFKDSTVSFTTHEMNAASQTLTLENCDTTFGSFSMAQSDQTVLVDGGTVTLAASKSISVNGARQVLKLKNVTLNIPSGQFNIGFLNASSVATTDAEVILDNAEIHQKGNVTRIGSTSVKSVLAFRGEAPKYVQEANTYVQSGTSGGAARPGGADFRFELPAAAYAEAPLQMTTSKASDCFYGNTCLVVDDTGVDRSTASVYPLVYSATAFAAGATAAGGAESFFALIKESATLPFGAELVLSNDGKTISVSLPALRSVVFNDDDGTILLATQKVVVGACAIAPAEVPYHAGYVFDGWTPDGGETKYSNAEVATVAISSDTAFVATYKTESKTAVDVPTVAESAAYTGEVNKPAIAEKEGYSIDWGEGDWIHAGSYTVTLTLTDTAKYIWSDGSSEPKAFGFTITQAANAWTVEPTVATSWSVGTTPACDLGEAKFGTATMMPSDLSALAVGKHTVTFAVAETDDYAGLEKAVSVKVRPAGLDPTGDPDATATTYTWKNEVAEGYWYNPASWTNEAEACFGYPANTNATAVFDGADGVRVVGEEDVTEFSTLQFRNNARVTLVGGNYKTTSVVNKTANEGISIGDGTLAVSGTTLNVAAGHIGASSGGAFVANDADITVASLIGGTRSEGITIAITNSKVKCSSVNPRQGNAVVRLHDVALDGKLEINGSTNYRTNNCFYLTGRTSITNQFQLVSPQTYGYIGPECRIKVTGTGGWSIGDGSILDIDGASFCQGSGSTISAKDWTVRLRNGATCDQWVWMGFASDAVSNAVYVIDDSTVTGGNQLYMPNSKITTAGDCAIELRGSTPSFTSGNTSIYCGTSDTVAEAKLPAFRFVLPSDPYAVAPVQMTSTMANTAFYANTRIELNLNSAESGTYPLIRFANGIKAGLLGANEDKTAFLTMLKKCLRAYKVGATGKKHDASSIVASLDFDGTTLSVTIVKHGMMLIIR